MKRIRVRKFGGPEVLELEEADDPRPGPGEVVVRVHAIGVNPYDTYMRAGAYGARNPALPYTPGSDAAGTVEAVGDGVAGLAVGDRVYTAGTLSGAYADRALCARAQVHLLPAAASFAQGAGLWVPCGTAYRALFQLGGARPGETVLVHGASGGVGTAAVQLARAAGLTVIGTAGSEQGLATVRAEGAHVAVDHNAADASARILEATGGRGVDVVVEMLANQNLGEDLRLMAPGGRVVVIGSRGEVQINPRDLMSREVSVRGFTLWATPERDAASIHAALRAALEAGTLRPLVGTELPLAAAGEAHRRILAAGAHGKIVLVP